MAKPNSNQGFIKKYPILWNVILIAITAIALIYASLFLVDLFTRHGENIVVPNVKNLSLQEAINKLEDAGLKYEITDSIYNDRLRPGQVADQTPKANSNVKSNRTIYITINAFSPRLISMPRLQDMSLRQAQSTLESLGLRNIRIEMVYSPFKDLVIDAKMNGLAIAPGTKVPASSYITLEVGDGSDLTFANDSLRLSNDSVSSLENESSF